MPGVVRPRLALAISNHRLRRTSIAPRVLTFHVALAPFPVTDSIPLRASGDVGCDKLATTTIVLPRNVTARPAHQLAAGPGFHVVRPHYGVPVLANKASRRGKPDRRACHTDDVRSPTGNPSRVTTKWRPENESRFRSIRRTLPTRRVQLDDGLEHLTFGWTGENVEGNSIPPCTQGGSRGVCLLRNREVL